MSLAWELTSNDVEEVLDMHNSPKGEWIGWVMEDKDRIMASVARFRTTDDQLAAAFCEIEDLLFEYKILFGNKKYRNPTKQIG